MCGICGITDKKGGYIQDKVIRDMAGRMAHRGPDDSGIFLDLKAIPHAGLGHRRLSIIDLSAVGRQPMSNEDGKIWIVLNGEIYNYPELKEELKRKGHIFKSDTDTEVVIHLYEEYGASCVRYLRGMFAFAIWDGRDRSLFIARDRIGKKPLVYCYDGGRFAFSSEFGSLLESGLADKEINREALDIYLTLGYIPAPLTIYKKVFKLPPAHTLTLKNGQIRIERYWQLDYLKKVRISEDEAADEVMRLLEEAVKIRLHSDVPLGAFLSGGIDSSAVVALMSRATSGRVKTFSIGFDDKDYNELEYARLVAKRFNTDHNELIVKPDAMSVLPILVERYGEPYADSSCIPTYYVCNQTRRYVTVALNGDGGDESFAGYERYQAMLISECYQKIPRLARSAIGGVFKLLPDSVHSKNRIRRLKRFMEGVNLPACERYLRWVSIFDDPAKKAGAIRLLRPYFESSRNPALLDKLLAADVNTYLPDDLLVKVDIASMANSLEARSPFLDHKLMEFAASLPASYKMKWLIKKYILKKGLDKLLPKEITGRKKMGFGLPVGSWFRGDLKGYLKDTILSEKALKRGYFEADVIKRIAEEHISGKKDHTFRLWSLLMLEMWHKRFID